MKKISVRHLRIWLEILYLTLPGAGILFLPAQLLGLSWSHVMIVAMTLLFQCLVYWSKERGLRVRIWAIVLGVNVLAGFVVWRGEEVPGFYFPLLGMEVACLAVAVAVSFSRGSVWLKAPFFIAILAGMVYFSVNGLKLEKWEVGLLLVGFLLFLAELAEYNPLRATGKGIRSAPYLFPVFLAGVLLLCLLPAKETPMRWELLRKLGGSVVEKLTSVIADLRFRMSGADEAYSLSFTGFDGGGKLGGGLFDSDVPQLSVEGIQTKSPLYLAGNIYVEYNGHGWEAQEPDPSGIGSYKHTFEDLEAAFERSIYTKDDVQELLKYRRFKINYVNIKTASMFIAPVTRRFEVSSRELIAREQGDALTLKKPQGPGFTYDLFFVEVNYADERMKALLRQQAFREEEPVLTPEEAGRRDGIYEAYTQLPEAVPQSVRDLAAEITAGADTDYDRMKAIQAYLSKFPYTTSPGKPPEDREFTEYFLLEGKQGYCTYFATAMAVLARCEGIPTRYVEGFVTDETCWNKDTVVELGSGRAHAWVEAYIDYVGWVPFEATPGYQERAEREWEPETQGISSFLKQEPPVVTDTPPVTEAEKEEERAEAIAEFGEGAAKALLLLVRLSGIAAVFLLVAIGFVTLRKALRRRAYAAMEPYEKLRLLMKRVLLLGGLCALPMESGETLSGYASRAQGLLDTPEAAFSQICRQFQSVRFGGNAVSGETAALFERYVRGMERKYLRTCGLWRKLLFWCVH